MNTQFERTSSWSPTGKMTPSSKMLGTTSPKSTSRLKNSGTPIPWGLSQSSTSPPILFRRNNWVILRLKLWKIKLNYISWTMGLKKWQLPSIKRWKLRLRQVELGKRGVLLIYKHLLEGKNRLRNLNWLPKTLNFLKSRNQNQNLWTLQNQHRNPARKKK
jgi:hypothetical protein